MRPTTGLERAAGRDWLRTLIAEAWEFAGEDRRDAVTAGAYHGALALLDPPGGPVRCADCDAPVGEAHDPGCQLAELDAAPEAP